MLGLAIVGCGSSEKVIPIEEIQTVTAPRPQADPNADTGARLLGKAQPASMGAAQAAPVDMFDWTTPEGWEELPATDLRLVNLKPAGHPDAECIVSVLPGGGGGMAENINRWRGQMGQPPYSQAEIDALPKATLLGREAVMVTFDGDYAGMSGGPGKPDFTMTGIILDLPNAGIFIKMVGPKDVIATESDRFMEFCQSLKLAESGGGAAHDDHEGHVHTDEGHDAHTAPGAAGDLAWDVPEGWKVGSAKPMRLVTLQAGPENNVECYIIVLPGDGGGDFANLERWARQMGQTQPLTPENVQALPTIPVLGGNTPLIELTGTYTDMSGNVTEGAMLIGTIGKKGGNSVYVRITGPEAAVKNQKDNFVAFCKSLR